MGLSFGFMWICLKAGLRALPVTAYMTVISFSLSLTFGSGIAIIRINRIRFFSSFFKIWIDIIKAIPGILILYIIYFSVTDGFNLVAGALNLNVTSKIIHVNLIAIIVLTFSGSVTVSETIRGAFMSVNSGQYDGAYSIGLTYGQTLKRVILPQAIPVAIPVLCNNLIVFIKQSSLMFFISVIDVLNASLNQATANYRYLDAYIAAALIYWAVSVLIGRTSKVLEWRLNRFRKEAI
jgi:L-cystine transport system permease protein